MKKSIKKVLGIALALIMVCTMIPAFASVAYGETNPGYGAVKVPYERKGNHDYQVQDPDWVHVYCIHPTKGGESNGANMNFRWKIDLLANKWMFDNSQRDVNGSNKPGSDDLNKLVSILWHGDKTNAHFMDIQNAVWWFVTNGTADYKTNTSSYKNSIVTAAGDSGWALPSSYQLYLYVPDREAASTTLQNAVRLVYSDVPETWEVGTTANVEGKGSSSKDAPLEFAIEEGKTKTAPLTVSDTIKYTGATAGMTFTIQTKLMKLNEDGTSTLIKDRGEQSPFTAEGEEGTWSGEMLTFWNVELEAGTYYFDEIVKNNASGKTVTHSGKGDNAQTFIVKSAGEETPEEPEQPEGELSTTVEVNGSKGSESAEAKVKVPAGEKSIVTDVKDTIDYKNLVKGNTYKVQGTLMEVAEDGSVSEVAKSDAEDKVAEDVNGTWEITFKNVTLEVGKKYVVFESATPIKDAENNEITDGKTIEHKNPEDKAQTVVVEEEEPTEEPPKEEPPKEEPPKEEPPKEEPPKEEEPKEEEPKEEEPPAPDVPSTGRPEEPTNNTPSNNPPQIPNTGTPNVPATGDAENVVIWMVLAAIAAFMTYTLMRLRRR